MKVKRITKDGTQREFVDELFSRIRPTTSVGEQLESRVQEMQSLIANKCGEFGEMLATNWQRDKREVCMLMPIYMTSKEKIDAVLEINVCLYDDLQYPNKLTNVEI